MTVFLGLAVFELIVLLLYYGTKNQKQRKWLYIIGCLGLFLVVGLRSNNTGNDTQGYVNRFLNDRSLDWSEIAIVHTEELGFYYFIKLIGCITDEPYIFLLITALVSLIGVFDLIWRNSKSPVLSLFLYITLGNFFFVLTGIRQAIAMSICMFAVRFVQERKLGRFVLLVWVAAQFHHSAYIFLVMYFLGVRRVNILSMITNIIVTIMAYFSYENLLEFANDILDYDYGVEETGNGFIFFAILLIISAFALVTKNKWAKEKMSLVILNSGIVCNILWVFRLIGRTAERPSMYWLNTVPIMLAESIESIGDPKNRMCLRIATIGFTFLFFAYRCKGIFYAFCF